MYHSGGNSTFQVVDIVGNTSAGLGGGMSARNGNLTLTSCTFQNNTAAPNRGPKVAAGAQLVPTVTNCIGFDVTEIYYGN